MAKSSKSKAKSISAGLLLYSLAPSESVASLRVLLAHPGGPYFAKKDLGAWSIPKGLVNDGEAILDAATREFCEETGYEIPNDAVFMPLGEVCLKSGKVVHAWALGGEWSEGREPTSNTFDMEWPPRSGKLQGFPEIDRAEMFSVEEANLKINERQRPFIDRLIAVLNS